MCNIFLGASGSSKMQQQLLEAQRLLEAEAGVNREALSFMVLEQSKNSQGNSPGPKIRSPVLHGHNPGLQQIRDRQPSILCLPGQQNPEQLLQEQREQMFSITA